MALDGVIFDLDGTLVDTNALHIEAWPRAFERAGYRIGADRIAAEVGKGGDKVIPALFGRDIDGRDGDALREAQPAEFARLAGERGIRPFPQAQRLIAAVRERGIKTALATSSGKDHLHTIERHAGIELEAMFDQLVSSDDIDQSKPAPEMVVAGVEKLGLSPAQCAMVGDTVWDAQACRDAGVACVGLTCGGESCQRLRAAGARLTCADPADLLDHLDEALRACSPGSAHLSVDLLESLMRQALDAARQGMEQGEAPIGCLLTRGDATTLLAAAHNRQNRTQNKTAHAEMVAFAEAAGRAPLEAKDLLLVSTLEPCVMCTGAAMEAGVDTIVYALRAPADSGTRRVSPPRSPESQIPRIVGNVLAQESRRLLEAFLQAGPRPQQAAYVRQLLQE